ncbi:MAG: hypothetical protein KIT58_05245 [Planctomycetota bacterium]|nr:hypothetical protein [Planctomycetota bacterium]
MTTRKATVPKVRRSLGPAWTGLTCPTCGEPYLDGLLDVHGIPFVKCRFCSFRVLGMTLRQAAALKFFGELLATAPVREGWTRAILQTLSETIAPPETTRTTVQAPEEAAHGDAA